MTMKPGELGLAISCAMVFYLMACLASLLRRRAFGNALFALGFATTFAAVTIRWMQVSHLPLQSMFEIFLCLGMLMFPLSLLMERVAAVETRGEKTSDPVSAALAFALLFPAAFIFKAEPQKLPPALQSWLFAPHVLSYLLSYIIFFRAGTIALAQIKTGRDEHRRIYRLALLGFPFMTAGLILGAFWGKLAWGDYWNWDPKELWSLATWLCFLAYLHLGAGDAPASRPRWLRRVESALIICGVILIAITLIWVNLGGRFASGLHGYAS